MAVVRKVPAKIIHIRNYSEDVKLFRIKPEKRIPGFKAGQFLHLALDPYNPSHNWPESRVFSIANAPGSSDHLDILVSRKGSFTGRMFDELSENSLVWIKLPYGDFNFSDTGYQDTVLIAGGTGVSPFLSFIDYALGVDIGTAIRLYYGVRSKDMLIGMDLFGKAKSTISGFSIKIFVEEGDELEIEGSGFERGMLPVESIIREEENIHKPVYYLSGPPVMINAFLQEMEKQQVNKERINFDKWE